VRSAQVCEAVRARVPGAKVEPVATASLPELEIALEGRNLAIAAGAAGVVLLPRKVWESHPALKVIIDLNAVPPAGIEGVEVGGAIHEAHGDLHLTRGPQVPTFGVRRVLGQDDRRRQQAANS